MHIIEPWLAQHWAMLMHDAHPHWCLIQSIELLLAPNAQHWAILMPDAEKLSHIDARCIALSHNDAWCASMSHGCTALSHGAQDCATILMHDAQYWAILSHIKCIMHSNIVAWCIALSHEYTVLSHNYWCIMQRYWTTIMTPDAQASIIVVITRSRLTQNS